MSTEEIENATVVDASSELDVLASHSSIKSEIRELVTGTQSMYTSIQGAAFEDRLANLNAVTNSAALADNLGVKINLRHIIVQSVDMTDERTGEVSAQPRVILIDDKGTAFHAISQGVFTSVKNIIGMLGEPSSWPGAVPVVASKEKARMGHFFTIKLA